MERIVKIYRSNLLSERSGQLIGCFIINIFAPLLNNSANADIRGPMYSNSGDTEVIQSLLQVNSWLYLSLFLMCFTTIIAVGITFYLYRWRRIILTDGRVLMPEELGASIRGLDHQIDGLTGGLHSFAVTMQELGQGTRDDAKNLLQTFMTLQTALDDRDQEIQRLKRGYDAEIFRRFLNRFIRVDQAADDIVSSGKIDARSFEEVRELLEDAFAECGVERFEPDLLSDYREANWVAENPKRTPTSDPGLLYKIAEVVEPGYLIRGLEGDTMIMPAKVCIYYTDKKTQEA